MKEMEWIHELVLHEQAKAVELVLMIKERMVFRSNTVVIMLLVPLHFNMILFLR